MNRFEDITKSLMWSMALLLGALAAGCGDSGRGSILGTGGITALPVADTTRPTVLVTQPATTIPGPTPNVPANTAITAVFSEPMAPATITAANTFTVTCAPACAAPSPAGVVSYSVASRTAVFTPAATLEFPKTYTATITTAATDLAGNSLAGNQAPFPAASNYVWTFNTVASGAALNVTVASTNPINAAGAVCPSATINATFTVPSALRMDPLTVNAINFTVTGPAPAVTSVTAASVALDAATGRIATFTPSSALAVGTYTATIIGGATGVKDLAIPGNVLAAGPVPNPWTFTVVPATGACLAGPVLGAAATFGTFGGSAGMTNQGIQTVINGDIGTIATGTSAITGFHDTNGDIYTQTPLNIGAVNGTIYTCTVSTTGPTSTAINASHCTLATQARLDAQAAYLALAALPGGIDVGTVGPAGPGELGGRTLAPGVYKSLPGSYDITLGDLTLDAGGNVNAVWVFQMATTLKLGDPTTSRSITLAGGAQPKNVFWQVGSAATIDPLGGGTMVGTIISQTGASFSTAGAAAITTLNGRVQSLVASVTVVNTVINVPAP